MQRTLKLAPPLPAGLRYGIPLRFGDPYLAHILQFVEDKPTKIHLVLVSSRLTAELLLKIWGISAMYADPGHKHSLKDALQVLRGEAQECLYPAHIVIMTRSLALSGWRFTNPNVLVSSSCYLSLSVAQQLQGRQLGEAEPGLLFVASPHDRNAGPLEFKDRSVSKTLPWSTYKDKSCGEHND